MGEIKVNLHYPYSEEYEYQTRLTRLNLDAERIHDLQINNGFVVSEPRTIKKDLKDINGIFSTRYGQTLQDLNPFADRYKCECGNMKSRIYNGITCPVCGTKVKFVDDNFNYFGWICLKDPYYVIHPNLFKSIQFLVGVQKIENIIKPVDDKDEDGFDIEPVQLPKDNPYFGLGMIGFKEKFDEIMEYFLLKNPGKKEYYDDIMASKNLVFIQSIPVYTTHLRPFKVEGTSLFFEGTNQIYNLMAKFAHQINKDDLKMYRKKKSKNQLLYDLQTNYNELYLELEKTLAQKKGAIRTLFGGRYNFSCRSVIVPSQDLGIDEVRLSYHALCGLLQQSIVNILQSTYKCSYSEAYKIWYKAQVKPSKTVREILYQIIKSYPRGIPILLNRNPTICYGGILQMYVVGINDNYTASIPLRILKGLAADFDGDTLNILYLINKDFIQAAEHVLNPRNSMQISRNDGLFNPDVNHQRDTLINANAMIYLSRHLYSTEMKDKIKALQNM